MRGPIIGLALIMMMLGGCYHRLPSYRYRLTVEVETPTGLKHGSSVIEIRSTDKGAGFPGPEAGGIDRDVVGEAVPVEIAKGVTLFALLTRPNEDEYATYLMGRLNRDMPVNFSAEDRINEYKRRRYPMPLSRLRKPIAPEREQQPFWPMFVIFRDIANPASVVEVDPENPDETLGPGVRIASVTAQITDDPITHTVRNYLPWIVDRPPVYFNGESTEKVQSKDIAAHLNAGSFIRGDRR